MTDRLRITVLVDNTPDPAGGLATEHGLSLLLEFFCRSSLKHSILFDCGAGPAFAANAAALGLSLDEVSALVLSHGHYDHGGGLERFFEINHHAPVYHAPEALQPVYWRPLPGEDKYLGLPAATVAAHRDRFKENSSRLELFPGSLLLTGLPRPEPLPPGNRGLCRRNRAGALEPDPFIHEQVLLLLHPVPILITGCAHSGIINLITAVQPELNKPLELVIGGFHLPDATTPAAYASATAAALSRLPVRRFLTGHCTGPASFQILEQQPGLDPELFHCGMQLEFSAHDRLL